MLYKYKKLFKQTEGKVEIDERIIDSINQNKIYVSSIGKLNDPFEKIYNLKPYSSYSEQERKELLELDKQKVPGFEDFGKDILENMDEMDSTFTEITKTMLDESDCGIFSMSENNDIILLWSHYTDNHTGICIGYDKQRFIDTKSCFKIKYKKQIPIYDCKKNYSDSIYRPYKYKFFAWNYEKEWRYISAFADELIDNPSIVKSVYFGLRVKTEDIEEFKKRINIKIKYYKAEFLNDNDNRDFKLVFKEI